MDTRRSYTLDCALTRHLENESTEDGEKAQFAAAILADLGHFDLSSPNIKDLKHSIVLLSHQRDSGLCAEMRRACASCSRVTDCPVGAEVLER
ncbi:MAG: hypothetical protein KF778_17685 [Rhodocyclaceae bacterium]|nr:hypothetical protein [Rhodocyclaceae bacterium]MBX3670236.1 hypothetical protein [Rhodocyclaceae bacterium]